MDPDPIAYVSRVISLAHPACVEVAFFDGEFIPRLLDPELSRKDVAHHVHIHNRLGGIGGSGLKNNIDYFDALVGGHLGTYFADFHQPPTRAKLPAIVGPLDWGSHGPCRHRKTE